jgi:ribosome-associated protein
LIASFCNITFTGADPINSESLALALARIAADKKAEDLTVLDLRGISNFTDFFLICSGTSEPHLKAVSGELQERMRMEHGIRPLSIDGFPASQWVVADFGSVVVHLFSKDKRRTYSLESLWNDAPRLAVEHSPHLSS